MPRFTPLPLVLACAGLLASCAATDAGPAHAPAAQVAAASPVVVAPAPASAPPAPAAAAADGDTGSEPMLIRGTDRVVAPPPIAVNAPAR
ncbi:MAG: hypothetical protein IT498_10080, partial [Rubrivivax sp.]|nr:hypothetical protein [Rubrivivax sp.]